MPVQKTWKLFEGTSYVYLTCVLITLLYSETWIKYLRHIKIFKRFHKKCLRRILKIHWQYFIPDTKILKESACISKEYLMIKNQMCWPGHFVSINNDRLSKCLFYGELSIKNVSQHKPRKRY